MKSRSEGTNLSASTDVRIGARPLRGTPSPESIEFAFSTSSVIFFAKSPRLHSAMLSGYGDIGKVLPEKAERLVIK